MPLYPYDRRAAVRYAHAWAYGRNPRFYDYELIGGDCTNFASQCLYAGARVMDYAPTYGWAARPRAQPGDRARRKFRGRASYHIPTQRKEAACMAQRKTEPRRARPGAARVSAVRVSYAEAGETLEALLVRYFTARRRR